MICNYHRYLIPEHFHHPPKRSVSSHFLSLPYPQPLICFLCLDSPLLDASHKWNPITRGFLWQPSFTSHNAVRVHPCRCLCHSFSWLILHCMQTPRPVCSLVGWWALGWAHPIAWVMLLWTFRYTLCGHNIFCFLGPISRDRIAGSSNDCNARKEPGLKLPLDWFVFWIQGLTLSQGQAMQILFLLTQASHSSACLLWVMFDRLWLRDHLWVWGRYRQGLHSTISWILTMCIGLTPWRCQNTRDTAPALKTSFIGNNLNIHLYWTD